MGDYREMPDAERDRSEQEAAIVARHVASLMEHFDAVQIFACRAGKSEAKGLAACDDGAGNWFARYGQVREWITKEDERTRLCVRRDFEEDDA